jgi:hypothetical protein
VVHAVNVEGNTRGEGGFRRNNGDWILALAVGDPDLIVTIIDELHGGVVDKRRAWLRGHDSGHGAGFWVPLPLVQTVGVAVVFEQPDVIGLLQRFAVALPHTSS